MENFGQTIKIFPIEDDDDIRSKIKEVCTFVVNIKNNYEYSKLFDKFIMKEDKIQKEEILTALCFIKHQKIEECCVCMDKTTSQTKCGHFLCRICYTKMYNISELVVTMASLYVAYNSWFFIEKICFK
jgi:hypothetical protein